MNDPLEGLDRNGNIVTGVARLHISSPYDTLVAECVDALLVGLGHLLHSIFVYGSVVTGQAVVGRSDLDLLVVVKQHGEAHEILAPVQARTPIVRSIGVGVVTLNDLLAPTEEGRIERCFLHHYCVCVWGEDLRSQTSPCEPTPALARGFAGGLLQKLPAVLSSDWTSVTDPAAYGRYLLMAAAMAMSVKADDWSTDRATGAALIAQDDAQAGQDAAAVWSWADSQGPSFGRLPEDHRAQLSRLSRWVHDAYEQLPPD